MDKVPEERYNKTLVYRRPRSGLGLSLAGGTNVPPVVLRLHIRRKALELDGSGKRQAKKCEEDPMFDWPRNYALCLRRGNRVLKDFSEDFTPKAK